MPRPFYKARRNTSGKKKKSTSAKVSTGKEATKTKAVVSRTEEAILLSDEESDERTSYKPISREIKKSRKSVSFGALGRSSTPESPDFSVLVPPPSDPDMAVVYTVNHSPVLSSKRLRDSANSTKASSTTVEKPRAKRVKKTEETSDSPLGSTNDLYKVKKEYRELLEKYEDLKRIGIQEAETNFGEYKRNAEDRFKFSDDLINQLKGQIAALKKSKTNSKEESLIEKQESDIQSLKEQIEQLQTKKEQLAANSQQDDLSLSLGLYKGLSDLKIHHVDAGEDVTFWECEQSGRRGAFRYLLRLEHDDPETYHFEPVLDKKDTTLLQILPAYLTEAISFSKRDAGVFFWKVFNSLQQES